MRRKNIKERVKEYFFMYPTAKKRVRQLDRELKLPLPSVIRYVKELEKEGILKSTIIAGMKIYAADRISKTFLFEKRLFNLRQLFYSGLIEYLDEMLSNPTIIIFGSYAKGEDREESDIDLYIETACKERLGMDKFEMQLQRRIQLFVYKDIHKVENKQLANNILNGVVINGFTEVFK